MSVAELKKATGTSELASKTKSFTFPEMLEEYKQQIALALPKHLNPDRMARIALTEFRKNPELGKCDPRSVFASIIIAAQLGLEPGVMGQAYLIPYGGTCSLVPGWQGYVDLVSRSGRASVWTGAVHVGDEFSYQMGTRPDLKHVPGMESDDDTPFTHVYAVGWVRNSQWPAIEVWSRSKVNRHLNRYNKVGKRHYALQNENNLEMYGRKVALLQVIKYMPKSIEVATAANLDYSADVGGQTISVKEAIEGTFIPAGYQDEAPTLEGSHETSQDEKEARAAFDVIGWDEKQIQRFVEQYNSDWSKIRAEASILASKQVGVDA